MSIQYRGARRILFGIHPIEIGLMLGVVEHAAGLACARFAKKIGGLFARSARSSKPVRVTSHRRRALGYKQITVADIQSRPDSAARRKAARLGMHLGYALATPHAVAGQHDLIKYPPSPLELAIRSARQELPVVAPRTDLMRELTAA